MDFTRILLPNGFISPAWRKKALEEGTALLSRYPFAKTIGEAWYCYQHDLPAPPACKTCQVKVVSFSAKDHQYGRFCCRSCALRNPGVRAEIHERNMEKYGVPIAGGFGTDAHKAGMVKKYGVDHPMRSDKIKQRVVDTNMERYGVENVFQSEVHKQRIVETVQERYGVDHVMQRPEQQAKYRNEAGEWIPAITNVEKRRTNTLATITEGVRQRLANNGFELVRAANGFSYHHVHDVKHLKCGKTFPAILYSDGIPRCYTCEPALCGTSKVQLKVEDFLRDEGLEIETNVSGIIGRKHLDIVIPALKLAIEVNGLYWHSELKGRNPGFHLAKTEAAAAAGYRLLHLFEDDLKKWDIITSMLGSLLGKSEKLAARKCKVTIVPKKDATAFCAANHLKGAAKFEVAIGLSLGEELVAVGTFAKARYDKHHPFEVIRFCSKLNTGMVGGFSKILKEFERLYHPSSILSYADRCYSVGNVYEKCGFELERITPPNYWYVQQCVRVHQTQLRKYKLPRLYPGIDMQKTEKELLAELGWSRIWDCGQLVFVKRRLQKLDPPKGTTIHGLE